MTTYVDFEAYRIRCEDIGMTPYGLAKKARVSKSVMFHMKQAGTAHPATVLALARALGCAVSDLVVRGDQHRIAEPQPPAADRAT